jgi:hypothetical protein
MPIAFITVDKMQRDENDFIKFTDKSQQYWNCNIQKLFKVLSPGNRVKIDYNVSDPKDPNKKPSKYINQARLANSEDPQENTFTDKDPFDPNRTRGGRQMSKDYDPEVSKRQTAANVMGNIFAHYVAKTGKLDLDEFAVLFPAGADVVLDWINEQPKSGSTVEAGADGQENIEF